MLRATGSAGALLPGSPGAASVLAQSYAAVSAPADTTEDTLATIAVPANTLGPNGALRITALFTITNSVNSKTLRIRYSGASGTTFHAATYASGIASVYLQISIANRGVTNSQVGPTFGANPFTAGSGGVVTSSVDTTAATSVVITGQKASAGETLTLEGYTVEVVKP